MNRRGFFSTLAKASAGFTILPAATTYERIWRVQRGPIRYVNPEWISAPYNITYIHFPWQVEILRCLHDEKTITPWLKFFNRSPFPYNMGDVK